MGISAVFYLNRYHKWDKTEIDSVRRPVCRSKGRYQWNHEKGLSVIGNNYEQLLSTDLRENWILSFDSRNSMRNELNSKDVRMSNSNSNVWFNEVIKPMEPSLRSWLIRQFPIGSGVDDVLQESYIRILKAREKRAISYPKSYLYRTARNVAYDFLQDSNVTLTDPLDESHGEGILADSKMPNEIAAHNQEVKLLKEAIGSLPKKCREIFTLRKVYDLSYKEIAARLNISERTISAQMNIGLRKCAKFIERKSGESRQSN